MPFNPFGLGRSCRQPEERGKPFLTGMRKITLRLKTLCVGRERLEFLRVRQRVAVLTFQRFKRKWLRAALALPIQLWV